MAYVGANIGDVKAVRMRYSYDKPRKFKGSVFAELGSEAEATAAVEAKLEFEGKPLIVRAKPEYMAQKRKEYEERKALRDGGAHGKRAREDEEAAAEKVYEKGTFT